MHILIVAPTPYFSDRGCHIRILEEVAALYRAGHTAEIFTYHLGRDVGPAQIHRIKPVRWYTKTSAGPAWGKVYLDWLLWRTIRKTVLRSKTKFDLIHAHLHEGAVIGWLIKKRLHIPLVLDAQGSFVAELKSYGWFTLASFEKWILARVDHIITSSNVTANYFKQHYSTIKTPLTVVPDAAPHFTLSPKPSTPCLAGERVTPTLIYTGSTNATKGFDLLQAALKIIKPSLPELNVVIIGDGYKKVRYEDLAIELNQASLGVDPKPTSTIESSGKMLNYMAAGLPVVAFRSVTSQEFLGDLGYYPATETAESLANTIIQALADPNLTARGAAGQTRVAASNTWDHSIKILEHVYDQLV